MYMNQRHPDYQTAIHEASHVVMCLHLGKKFTTVWIANGGGAVEQVNLKVRVVENSAKVYGQEVANDIMISIAGRIGEIIGCGYSRPERCGPDNDRAYQYQKSLGLGNDIYRAAETKAKDILLTQWPTVLNITQGLLDNGTLTYNQVKDLLI